MKRETADQSKMPIRRLFVGTQPEDSRKRASRRPDEADARPRPSRDHRLYNADRMLMTTTLPVVARLMILMTDGRMSFTVVHQSSPEHRFISVKGGGIPRRHRVRWWNTTTSIVTKIDFETIVNLSIEATRDVPVRVEFSK